MKEFSEEQMYDINEQFQAKLLKEAADQKRIFYIMLLIALGLLATGFLLCLLFVK